jgi:hypothetical protein
MSEYDTDLVTWSRHQADLLRRMGAGEQVNDRVDWANVAEEIDSLGKSDRRELGSRIQIILQHLIKLQVSPATRPRAGWKRTILGQRAQVEGLLKDSPSLRPTVPDAIKETLDNARELARLEIEEFREELLADPAQLTFGEEQVLGSWLPD